MQTITTVGLDIAKSVFQVHGVDAEGNVVIRRQLKRRYVFAFFEKLPPCLVGIEACASAHHWSRELQTLGHTVRLMTPERLSTQRPPTSNAQRWNGQRSDSPSTQPPRPRCVPICGQYASSTPTVPVIVRNR